MRLHRGQVPQLPEPICGAAGPVPEEKDEKQAVKGRRSPPPPPRHGEGATVPAPPASPPPEQIGTANEVEELPPTPGVDSSMEE